MSVILLIPSSVAEYDMVSIAGPAIET